jgi:hypothetical protein
VPRQAFGTGHAREALDIKRNGVALTSEVRVVPAPRMKTLAAALFSVGCAIVATACSSSDTSPSSATSPASTAAPTDPGSLEGNAADDGAVACDACFPVESLSEDLRAKAETTLLAALDGEALYTLLSEMKPMSSGFSGLTFSASKDSVPELDALRSILQAFQCTSRLTGDVQVFAQAHDGEKSADALLFHRPRFAATIEKYPNPFASLQIVSSMAPLDAVDRLDRDPTTKRFRAYGYLFGYPEHAVDFFVSAEETETTTGKFVERDFVHIPTFAKPTGAFTYAVPKGQALTPEDVALREKAAPVLAAYRKARTEHIKGGKGAARLLRTVFDDGSGRCKPENAEAYVAKHGAGAKPEPVPVCAEAGEQCAKNTDCCSADCHGDHCH